MVCKENIPASFRIQNRSITLRSFSILRKSQKGLLLNAVDRAVPMYPIRLPGIDFSCRTSLPQYRWKLMTAYAEMGVTKKTLRAFAKLLTS